MKILGIVCSPRRSGNTEIMVQAVLDAAKAAGAEIELWTVAGKNLSPCDGCLSCFKNVGKCHIDDDMQPLYPKLREADGIVFGTPVYSSTISAQTSIIMQRMYCMRENTMVDKIAGGVVVGGGEGHEGATLALEKYFNWRRMIRADIVTGFGRDKGDVKADIIAMKHCNLLGRSMVAWVKQGLHQPPAYAKALYRILLEEEGIKSWVNAQRFSRIDETK